MMEESTFNSQSEEKDEVEVSLGDRIIHARSNHLERLIQRRTTIDNFCDEALQPARDVDDITDKADDMNYNETFSKADLSELGLSRPAIETIEQVKHLRDVFSLAFDKAFVPKLKKLELRLHDFSYLVLGDSSEAMIKTVFNQSCIYSLKKSYQRFRGMAVGTEVEPVPVLNKINLALKPGNMYLVLGAPSSGKTTLLRAIANLLPVNEENDKELNFIEGRIEYNGLTQSKENSKIISSCATFVEQLDNHAPRLTVKETLEFAFQCRSGGTHASFMNNKTPEAKELIKKLDESSFMVNYVLESLGLAHVGDTFVGDSDIRGVSGGQRRRVTTGEMMQFCSPVVCADEISTGLDSTSTYEIIQSFMFASRLNKTTRIMSLLQPSPETFSLFDEVILLAEGCIVYAGPIDQAVGYFNELGYQLPDSMDVADFLQTITTSDGAKLFHPSETYAKHFTPNQFREIFCSSRYGKNIKDALEAPLENDWRKSTSETQNFEQLYSNSLPRSIWLNLQRHFTIWKRDKRYVVALAVKNVIMGLSVGAVFFQRVDSVDSVFGVLFQAMLFIMLGAMTSVPEQINDRSIFYKQHDANFFQTAAFVIGRSISLIPQSTMDCFIFGSMIYWMVGLGPTGANFFIFIFVILTFTLTMSQMLGIFASFAASKSVVQGASAFIMLLLILFCGFIVTPDVIPRYYSWLYWWNPLAWAYRALLVNEFTSVNWNQEVILNGTTTTRGEVVLFSKGFILRDEPFGKEWIGFSFAYLIPFIIVCIAITGVILNYYRVEGKKSPVSLTNIIPEEEVDEHGNKVHSDNEMSGVTFIPVDLTFETICYEVKASTGSDKLKLLNNISGVFSAGRMCALMGSSGAGKTTLMDVISLRKTSGTITGEVRLNGHLQERIPFRRCSGYVEQFDVQTPELTVRETILFSAQLRLDRNQEAAGDIEGFVNKIIKLLELTSDQHLLVGTYDEGGLSFEQRKRLSIAVELAASPSIIFLDEPTSGLDSRAAMLVMSSLKRICDSGRTVCATIHQPSSTIFDMFDDLLLLKKGGETVYFGELGESSVDLINYFERLGGTPINIGENPATWMLNVIQSKDDFAESYTQSKEYAQVRKLIEDIKTNPNDSKKITYDNEFVATASVTSSLMNKRLRTIYWRSPAYNLGRLTISVLIAFILSSVFFTKRHKAYYEETEMSSILSTIFISFIIVGVLSITTVLPVMLSIRDVFYRHRAAGMLDYKSLAFGLGIAEKPFILLASTIFCLVFYFGMGLTINFRKFLAFWGYFTFYVAISSYFGQAFMCLVRGMKTAQILASVFIGLNNFFSGLIVRPQFMTGFWQTTYWITPGHYVYEGLVMSQFQDDNTPVHAKVGSVFFNHLNCTVQQTDSCSGTTDQYIDSFFGGRFHENHMVTNVFVLGFYLIIARGLTYFALKKFNYSST